MTRALRFVIVAYHYPPDPAVGSLRARNVALALANAGHEVHVVSVALPNEPSDTMDDAIHVRRVVPAVSVRDLLTRVKRLVSHGAASGRHAGEATTSTSGVAWKRPDRISGFRRFVGALTWLPDDRHGFIVPAARAASQLLRGDGRDVLYTTAPPFSDHVVGLLLRRRRALRWIVEYRDPWTDGSPKPWFVRTRLIDEIDRWAERACLRRSDGIVTVSGFFADVLARRMGPVVSNKMLVARNGIPRMLPPIASDAGSFLIVYAGSFYLHRDPKPFLTALAAVHRRGIVAPRRLDVRLVGDCRFFEGEPIEPLVDALGLSNVVTFVDWLPHQATMELMRRADLLLLLAQAQPLSVPNKLFEYVGMGKPVLAATDADGETTRLLREIGGHFVVGATDGSQVIERALEEAIATSGMPRPVSPVLAGLATEAQMRILTDWIDQRLGTGAPTT